MEQPTDHRGNGSGTGKGRWIFLGFALVAGFFLFTEHRAHVFGVLPYLLLLACPLMHLFHGHGAHGRHRADGHTNDQVGRTGTSLDGDTRKPDKNHTST